MRKNDLGESESHPYEKWYSGTQIFTDFLQLFDMRNNHRWVSWIWSVFSYMLLVSFQLF